ncbi:alpha/beta fold hydrolase [Phycicoccus sp. Root101]|uniref:alpha/beta fold hydrolase n=1 Tax=Phycicoccus sp. Root101 TaxID=1736421 RepID=UPI00070284DB|nr:alpha/beta hydrolase [Phycicoccus sp. Root101]KQU69073.1 alpha/beta hydrolase [Phycicoccus sp. Root101]
MTDTDLSTSFPDITVALVHGAFADSSGWNGVIELLAARGLRAVAISNPLRGVAYDSDYVASALSQITGRVVAVGHSYGGAVITNAVTGLQQVKALVYVAAFAPDEGEVLGQITADSKDSVLSSALTSLSYPIGDGSLTATEFAIKASEFHSAFAADLSPKQAAVMAATQRPVAEAAFTQRSSTPAWKSLPCWAVVATGDRAAGSDVVRRMATRAGAKIIEAAGSHVIMISRPEIVTGAIVDAVRSVA